MSAGIYNTKIEAGRNLVRRLQWTDPEGSPIDLTNYPRQIYNIQTKTSPIVEVVTADSELNPDWIFREAPFTDGYLRIAIPATSLIYVPSINGLYEHEFILIDNSDGATPLFRGDVVLKPPIVSYT